MVQIAGVGSVGGANEVVDVAVGEREPNLLSALDKSIDVLTILNS